MPALDPCSVTPYCLPCCMLTACSGIRLCSACLQAARAGAQAGWGFTKPHPSWPKPDRSAATALDPLRRVSNHSLQLLSHRFSFHVLVASATGACKHGNAPCHDAYTSAPACVNVLCTLIHFSMCLSPNVGSTFAVAHCHNNCFAEAPVTGC